MKPLSARARRAPLASLALTAVCLFAACQGSGTASRSEDEVANLILHGQYAEAVTVARRDHERRPDDEALEERYRTASVAWLLEQGRRATFDDRDVEALDFFERARELAPEEPVIESWIVKTHEKLADRWLERGLQAHSKGQLHAAVDAYEKSLRHYPGHASAVRGLTEATLQINHRAGLAHEYYDEGVRSLREWWLQRSRRSFAAVEKYRDDPSERVDERRGQVENYLADERATVAQRLEEEGYFDAARNEYRLCLALDPDHPAAVAGFERMDREAKAVEILREARMDVLRGRLDEARELATKGLQLTEQQDEMFEGVLDDVETARAERMYQEALSLEKDYRYQQAIGAYQALLEEFDYYKDAIARRRTLQDHVEQAPRYYAEAEAESDLATKLGLYQAANDVWPEFRDVEQRIAELEATLDEREELPEDETDGANAEDEGPAGDGR